MRLVTYDAGNGSRLGAIIADKVVDLPAGAAHFSGADLPNDMLALIQDGQSALDAAEQVVSGVLRDLTSLGPDATYDLEDVRLLAPLSNPPKLVCLGLNYKEHAIESNEELPTEPLFFSKFSSAIIGLGETIKRPRQSETLDFETELTFVIGRGGRHIPEEEAMDHVFGYTIMMDISLREYQYKWSQWLAGKTFDTFAPLGPAIVTADEIEDPHDLQIKFTINEDEEMQNSNTNDMLFKIPHIISFASSIFSLEPGDLFATGSPPGVGEGRTPPRWLRPGEQVTAEIEGIGKLTNPVEAE